jgi:hypothetical protein
MKIPRCMVPRVKLDTGMIELAKRLSLMGAKGSPDLAVTVADTLFGHCNYRQFAIGAARVRSACRWATSILSRECRKTRA